MFTKNIKKGIWLLPLSPSHFYRSSQIDLSEVKLINIFLGKDKGLPEVQDITLAGCIGEFSNICFTFRHIYSFNQVYCSNYCKSCPITRIPENRTLSSPAFQYRFCKLRCRLSSCINLSYLAFLLNCFPNCP
jgi:hypothetical protein